MKLEQKMPGPVSPLKSSMEPLKDFRRRVVASVFVFELHH